MFAIVLGLLVTLGWHTQSATLVQLHPNLVPMAYNTAVMLVAGGFGIASLCFNYRIAAGAFGWSMAIFGFLSLLQHILNRSFHLDFIFSEPFLQIVLDAPTAIAPNTGLAFLLLGAALILLVHIRSWFSLSYISVFLSTLVFAMGLAAVFGYCFDFKPAYGWANANLMAFHTALGTSSLALGILAINWQISQRSRQTVLPRWIAIFPTACAATITMVLWQTLKNNEHQKLVQMTNETALRIREELSSELENRVQQLRFITRRWEIHGPFNREEWETDAELFLAQSPDLQALEWVDTTYHVRWVVPLKGNESIVDQDSAPEERRQRALETSLKTRRPVMTEAISLKQGGKGFLVYLPIFRDNSFDGFTVGAFTFERIFKNEVESWASRYAFQLTENDNIVYASGMADPGFARRWSSETVKMHGVSWKIHVAPTPELVKVISSKISEAVLGFGLIISSLLGGLMAYSRKYHESHHKLLSLNTELEADIAKRVQVEAELKTAISEVHTLEGIIPICAGCKKIRDDAGYWNQIESYIQERSAAKFSHGLCPECLKVYFPGTQHKHGP